MGSKANQEYIDNLKPTLEMNGVDMHAVMDVLNEKLPADAIITNDAGNFPVGPGSIATARSLAVGTDQRGYGAAIPQLFPRV